MNQRLPPPTAAAPAAGRLICRATMVTSRFCFPWREESAERPRHCEPSGQTRCSSTSKTSASRRRVIRSSCRRPLAAQASSAPAAWTSSAGGCSPDTPALNGLSRMDARRPSCLIWPRRPHVGCAGREFLSVDQPPACPVQKRADPLGGWLRRTRPRGGASPGARSVRVAHDGDRNQRDGDASGANTAGWKGPSARSARLAVRECRSSATPGSLFSR